MTSREVKCGHEDELAVYLCEALPEIDRILAAQEFPLHQRPFQAAIDFVQHCVLSVQEVGNDEVSPSDTQKFIATRWFSVIYHHVDQWYRDRYGAALDQKANKNIRGVIEIADTPFELRVPTMRTRPGKPGKTVWISIPDGMRGDENAIEWVVAGPNIDRLDEDERGRAITEATQTANQLRYIRTSLMAVSHGDNDLVGLMAGILPRIENAASYLIATSRESIQHAYWEMQLACEHALKALGQQQRGTFRETHDLFTLYDATEPKPVFTRDTLKHMPAWRETAEMRYGVGDRGGRRLCIKTYRSVLAIVAGSVRSMKKMGIGHAEFEIQRPPWFAITDEVRQSAATTSRRSEK